MAIKGNTLSHRHRVMMNVEKEYQLAEVDPEHKVRVSAWVRPWVLKGIDEARDSSGLSRSMMVDLLLGWVVDDMMTQHRLTTVYTHQDDSLPVPKIGGDDES